MTNTLLPLLIYGAGFGVFVLIIVASVQALDDYATSEEQTARDVKELLRQAEADISNRPRVGNFRSES